MQKKITKQLKWQKKKLEPKNKKNKQRIEVKRVQRTEKPNEFKEPINLSKKLNPEKSENLCKIKKT